MYLPYLDGEISGRGCATKDRIFTRHCENHVMKGIQVINRDIKDLSRIFEQTGNEIKIRLG